MKQFFLLSAFALFITSQISAQTMQASIGAGSTPNRAKVYLKANVATMTNISTLEFNVAIPESVTPKPTMAVISTIFPGVTWNVNEKQEGGYYNYYITTATSPIVYQLPADLKEFEALEVEFSGGGMLPSISLVTFPNGGSNSFLLFYCTGSPQSDGSNLYYSRTGTTVDNKFSYDITGETQGTGISTATILAGPLPIKLSDFTANEKNGNTVLNWSVENQDAQSSHFEIERSFNGTDFENIGAVNLNGNAINNYSYTDENINISNPGAIVYYRLKMVDKDGQFTYSEIKNIRLYDKGLGISLYPNPAKNSSKLNLNLDNPGVVRISITNVLGEQVSHKEYSGQKGLNQYNINLSKVGAGSYIIKIQANNKIQTIPLIKE